MRDAANGRSLPERQRRALAALMATTSRDEAAQAAGVAPRTLRSYLADPDFRAAYDALLDASVDAALDSSRAGLSEAVDALRTIVADRGATASARVSAARVVLEYVSELAEMREFDRRLRALEEGSNETV